MVQKKAAKKTKRAAKKAPTKRQIESGLAARRRASKKAHMRSPKRPGALG